MKLSLVLPLMLSTATFTTPAHGNVPGERPDALLGTDWSDSHLFLPLTLVRDESIDITVQVDKGARGLACKLTYGDIDIATDNGITCHLSAKGHGMRSYVLHVSNLDQQSHQVFFTLTRGHTR